MRIPIGVNGPHARCGLTRPDSDGKFTPATRDAAICLQGGLPVAQPLPADGPAVQAVQQGGMMNPGQNMAAVNEIQGTNYAQVPLPLLCARAEPPPARCLARS